MRLRSLAAEPGVEAGVGDVPTGAAVPD